MSIVLSHHPFVLYCHIDEVVYCIAGTTRLRRMSGEALWPKADGKHVLRYTNKMSRSVSGYHVNSASGHSVYGARNQHHDLLI